MASTIQSGIKRNTKDYSKFSYFLGGVDVTQQNLDQFTPFIQGVSRIFMYQPPIFMDKAYHEETVRFKSILESGYTRVSGIGDISVEFTTFEGGFNADKFNTVASATDETDTLTITVYEQTGSPVREYLDTWVTGTRDIRTGIAHYHGALNQYADVVKYGEKYHTAEFIYMVLDPTAQEIEYACMFAQAFPTKVPKDHLNYEKGTRENVSLDLEFRCKKYESPAINRVAQYYLANSKVEYNYLAFTPNITEAQVKAATAGFNYGSGNTTKF